MVCKVTSNPEFLGFPDFQANVTFTPIQFFTVVIPYSSRGTICIVGYVLRKLLGWVDQQGNPTQEQLEFSYKTLDEQAGVSRGAVGKAVKEAVARRFLCKLSVSSPKLQRRQIQGATFALRWDPSDKHAHAPETFGGFYYPDAVVVEEQDGVKVIRRPKAARKNIPNAFFDYLLPRERLAVIRVVSALLFRSIQWGPGGERRVPVNCSITELSRLTRLSRRHVHAAVVEACQRGYLERVDSGFFDPAAGQTSRTATYAIRWVNRPMLEQQEATPPVKIRDTSGDNGGQSKKVNGDLFQKGERNQSKKVNGGGYKKVNGINIKTELKTKLKTTAPEPSKPKTTDGGAAVDGFEMLVQTGFDAPTARLLANRHSLDTIERQIQWLPLRSATRNRLGFLRRAIEQNWPKPQGASEAPELQQGHTFASHYYAGYHGYAGQAATEPFPKDLDLASKFVMRLLVLQRNEELIPEWGRRFGCLMRNKHQGDAKAKPNLSAALVLYGDRFLQVLQGEFAARQRDAVGKAQEAHEAAFTPEYISYLRLTELTVQQSYARLYEAFIEARRNLRHLMTSGPFLASAELIQRFDSDTSRLLGFAEHFHKHSNCPVLSFWEWDTRLNPHRFASSQSNAGLQEQHA